MASMRIPVAIATLLALTAFAPAPASAACFESGVGCTNTNLIPYWALQRLSCDALWTVRNTIFYEHGYCFQTARGRAAFDNSGCAYYNSGDVPMSHVERDNVNRVLSVERARGCR